MASDRHDLEFAPRKFRETCSSFAQTVVGTLRQAHRVDLHRFCSGQVIHARHLGAHVA